MGGYLSVCVRRSNSYIYHSNGLVVALENRNDVIPSGKQFSLAYYYMTLNQILADFSLNFL